MNPLRTLATTRRVLQQLRHDPRTMILVIGVPILLMTILKFLFDGQPHIYQMTAPLLLGIFPLFIMFLITSIATLRERTSGTLDRLMTQPISKLDFVFGYALAFSIVGLVQAAIVTIYTLTVLDVSVAGGLGLVLVTSFFAAFLGTALGLFVSAFARNEFQAVQLVMPILMPQVLLCGLFVPRDQMASGLERISNLLPLTYSVDAMREVAQHANWTADLTINLLVVLAFGIGVLLLGTVTIRRQEK
ncbi:MAG: ABC transporter permease [Candidatus Saccharibacteria bacterium]|nr:ABC transporter permease [Candidatus Saccharibacteria bacterium]